MEDLILYIDLIDDSTISGWALENKHANMSLELGFFLGEECIGFTRNNCKRNDVKKAGFGDGFLGFNLPISRYINSLIKENVPLYIVAGQSAVFQYVNGVLSKAAASCMANKTVYIDISELLTTYVNTMFPTGIQRVQIEYIKALEKNNSCLNVVLSYRLPQDPIFKCIPKKIFFEIIKASEIAKFDKCQWTQFISECLSLSFICSFKDSAYFLEMGAVWNLSNHEIFLVKIKLLFNLRIIQFVHDMIPLKFPEYVTESGRLNFLNYFTKSVDFVDMYLGNSSSTNADLKKFILTNHPLKKVGKFYFGSKFNCEESKKHFDCISSKVEKIIETSYVLFVSTIEPRKNHRTMLMVWRMLHEAIGENCPKLVLVGKIGWMMESFIEEMQNFYPDKCLLYHLVDVSDCELEVLYKNSIFTLYPSIYEGWGLPITESLSFGKVCVTSTTSSMPEAGGDFCIYIDPINTRDCFEKIQSLITDKKYTFLSEHIANTYVVLTWEESALKTIDSIAAEFCFQSRKSEGVQVLSKNIKYNKLDDNIPYFDLAAPKRILFSNQYDFEADNQELKVMLTSHSVLYEPEPWGVWSYGDEVNFIFGLENQYCSSDVYCFLEIQPPPYSYSRIDIYCSGELLHTMSADSFLPHLCLVLNPKLSIRSSRGAVFFIELCVVNRIGNCATTECRNLGLGVKSFCLMRSNDISGLIFYMLSSCGIHRISRSSTCLN